MKAKQIQAQLEKLHYWDARVLRFDVQNFCDELTIVFEDSDRNIKLLFTGCFKIMFYTNPEDRRNPIKELTISQIPYFIQDIELNDILVNGHNLLNCKILMPPINIEINCSSIFIGELMDRLQ